MVETWIVLHNDEIKELDALVSLIDEPNEEMYHAIKHKVLSYGNQAIPILEEAWVNTLGDNDSMRIEALIDEIRQKELVAEYDNWRKIGKQSLWEGYLLVMKYLTPNSEFDRFNSFFSKLVKEIWLEINENLTALEKIRVINHVLFTVNDFKPFVSRNPASESFFPKIIIDKKSANSYSFAFFYLAITQELDIPVFGVDLPGHFILAFIDERLEIKQAKEYSEEDVLFYLNPSNEGSVFTHNEIRHYLSQMDLTDKADFYKPLTNTDVLIRLIKEIIRAYYGEENNSKAEGLTQLL